MVLSIAAVRVSLMDAVIFDVVELIIEMVVVNLLNFEEPILARPISLRPP